MSVFPLTMLFDYCVKETLACSVLKDSRGVSVLSCGLRCVRGGQGVSGTVQESSFPSASHLLALFSG